MPCSCNNAVCLCEIPCNCSEESCKCQDFSEPCKICNKPLINEMQTEKGVCSCFMREFPALVQENQNNPKFRPVNISEPFGSFVPAKLIFNVMIPIPVPSFPHLLPQTTPSLVLPLPSTEANNSDEISFPELGVNSNIPDSGVLKSLDPAENSDLTKITESRQFLDKSSKQSNDSQSFAYSSNSKENTGQSLPEIPIPTADQSECANIVQGMKLEKEHANIQERTYFYLPSVRIGNKSYPVSLMEPVWRFPNSYSTSASDSTLQLCNPFLVPENTPLQINGLALDPTKFGEQSNFICDGNVKLAIPSNKTIKNISFVFPFSGNLNNAISSEQSVMLPNCLPGQKLPENLNLTEWVQMAEFSRNYDNFQLLGSFQENESWQNDRRELKNFPLYIDPSTTKKMGKLLKPILKTTTLSELVQNQLNLNSPK